MIYTICSDYNNEEVDITGKNHTFRDYTQIVCIFLLVKCVYFLNFFPSPYFFQKARRTMQMHTFSNADASLLASRLMCVI